MCGRAAVVAGRDDVNCAIELMEEGGSEETTAGSSAITARVVGRLVSNTIRSGHFLDDLIRTFGGFDIGLLPASIRFAGRYASAMNNAARRTPPTTVKYRNKGICTDGGGILFFTPAALSGCLQRTSTQHCRSQVLTGTAGNVVPSVFRKVSAHP